MVDNRFELQAGWVKSLALICAMFILVSACTAPDVEPITPVDPTDDVDDVDLELETTDVKVLMGTHPGWLYFYAAEEHGFWEQRGLDVDMEIFVGGLARALEAVITGETDISYTGSTNVLQLAETTGEYVTMIHYGLLYDVRDGVSSGGNRLMVRGDSPIESIADLAGTRLAIIQRAGFEEALLVSALEEVGVDPREVEFVEAFWADHQALMEAGEIDVSHQVYPFVVFMENAGFRSIGDPVLGDPDRGIPWLLGPGGAMVVPVVAREDYVKNNPNTVQAFLLGLYDAIDWIHDNPSAAFDLLIERTGQPEEALRASPPFRYLKFPDDAAGDFLKVAEILVEAGLLEDVPDLERITQLPFREEELATGPQFIQLDP